MTDKKYEKAVFEPIGYIESVIDPEHNYNPREIVAKIIIKKKNSKKHSKESKTSHT